MTFILINFIASQHDWDGTATTPHALYLFLKDKVRKQAIFEPTIFCDLGGHKDHFTPPPGLMLNYILPRVNEQLPWWRSLVLSSPPAK
jgi:hypothetical protein